MNFMLWLRSSRSWGVCFAGVQRLQQQRQEPPENDLSDMDGYGEEDDDVLEAHRWMQRMGMGSFAKATMWLLREVFGMPEEWMICDADADEGCFLLERVMAKEKKAKKGEHGSARGICRCSGLSRVRTYIC